MTFKTVGPQSFIILTGFKSIGSSVESLQFVVILHLFHFNFPLTLSLFINEMMNCIFSNIFSGKILEMFVIKYSLTSYKDIFYILQPLPLYYNL